jgi:hypothetical protein
LGHRRTAGDDRADEVRVLRRRSSDHEEGRAHVESLKDGQGRGSVCRVRFVVEGERDE